MGTAEEQGELWGARARDWADLQEPAWKPIYESFLGRLVDRPGSRLLDVGCGAGGALVIARALGAEVSGLDASKGLAAVARERLPGARIETGEMERLPFADDAFHIVTGFNSFQFAGDIVRAFGEARRVCRPQGRVATLVWGRKEECELFSVVMPSLMAFLPPPPAAALTPFDFGLPGVMEGMMEKAGLVPQSSGEIDGALEFRDIATAVRAISSAGPATRAIRVAGEDAVREALAAALRWFVQDDGSVVLGNRFRWVVATAA